MVIDAAIFGPLVCMVAALILCVFAAPISQKLGLLDVPDARKQHPAVTPLMGGVTLLFAVVPVTIVVALLRAPSEWVPRMLVWVIAVVAMALIGLADDRHTLSARDRLVASFLVFGSAAVLDPLFTVRVLSFAHPAFELGVGTGWLAAIFTTICCVGLVNAVNMADGKNGLVIGLCLGWLGILATRAPAPIVSLIGILAAAWLVLLLFNLRGRLFLGDGGTYGVATAIGLVAIATYNTPGNHAGRMIAADELVVLFGVPIIDSFRLTFARLREGRSPMSADRNHLHHHLQRSFGWPGGLIVYWVLALAPPLAYFSIN